MSLFTFKEVTFKREKKDILKQVSFDIKPNHRTAIVGPNGAGKSTVNLHLNGLHTPSSGEVFFCDQLLDKKLRQMLPSKVGIVFQDPDDQIVSLTVRDDVAFGPLQLGVPMVEATERVTRYLQMLQIEDLADRNPSELSYGQKKYVTIAGILAMETEVIVFDEPMAFLDPKGKEGMATIMNELHTMGKSVIVTTHDMHFVAEWADEVVVIFEGDCLGSYTPSELFANRELISKARLDLPPIIQLLADIWQEEWGQMPLKVAEAKDWLHERISS